MSVMTGSDSGIDGDWKCFICSVQTLSNALLINHMSQIHSQTPNPGRDLSQSLKEMFQNDDCQINDQQVSSCSGLGMPHNNPTVSSA